MNSPHGTPNLFFSQKLIKINFLINICSPEQSAEEYMADEFQRRLPSAERDIADIRSGDIRISVTGTVIDIKDTRLVLDDGTGKIDVSFDSPPEAEINQLVRIFGRVIPLEKGFELQADVIQDMSKLDLELRKKVKGLKI
jgi:hypothetical protein